MLVHDGEYALAETVAEALRCKETGEEKVILTALCGHGHLDLPAYGAYLAGEMSDHSYEEAEIRDAVEDGKKRLAQLVAQGKAFNL